MIDPKIIRDEPDRIRKMISDRAVKFNGIGGGHNAAAGAKITKDKLDEFLDYIEENVSKLQTTDINQ